MSSKLHVWQLEVTIPEAYLQPGWEPQDWKSDDYYETDRHFTWPRRRNYLSEQSAYRRADLLRRYGAFVTVKKSKPVEFHEDPDYTDPDYVEFARMNLTRMVEDDS